MSDKIIYSKQFPEDEDFLPEPAIHTSQEELKRRWNELMEMLGPQETHTPYPDRVGSSQRFIDEAIETAEICGIDTEIVQKADRIVVTLSVPRGPGPVTYLKELFMFADEIYFFDGQKEGYLEIVFKHWTHE